MRMSTSPLIYGRPAKESCLNFLSVRFYSVAAVTRVQKLMLNPSSHLSSFRFIRLSSVIDETLWLAENFWICGLFSRKVLIPASVILLHLEISMAISDSQDRDNSMITSSLIAVELRTSYLMLEAK
jgi:hypothetical protein